jgi:putative membrane protein
MNLSSIRRISPALATLMVAGSAFAADLPHHDKSFMKDAAESGLAEVQASQLAAQNAANTQVKSFADQMVQDHTKANDELKALAAQKKLDLPTEPSLMERGELKTLKDDKGEKFDKRYADHYGVKAHEKTIKLFEKEVKDGKDADVKAWAEKTLPTLRHHLDMARDMDKAVGGSKANK